MSTDKTRILVAVQARLWLAPVGTVAPDGPTVVMPTGWYEAGLFTPDSLSFATDPSIEQVRSHQSNYPTREFQTEDNASFEVDLQEWSSDNIKAVFGGGTFTAVTTPQVYTKYTPPAIGGRTQVAACLEITDGTKKFRRMVPVASQREGVSQSLQKGSESTLPLRMTVIGADVGDAWYDMYSTGFPGITAAP